jgi:hypothetical protein
MPLLKTQKLPSQTNDSLVQTPPTRSSPPRQCSFQAELIGVSWQTAEVAIVPELAVILNAVKDPYSILFHTIA